MNATSRCMSISRRTIHFCHCESLSSGSSRCTTLQKKRKTSTSPEIPLTLLPKAPGAPQSCCSSSSNVGRPFPALNYSELQYQIIPAGYFKLWLCHYRWPHETFSVLVCSHRTLAGRGYCVCQQA